MATIAEVQKALAARRERQKEDGPVEKSKPEGKAKSKSEKMKSTGKKAQAAAKKIGGGVGNAAGALRRRYENFADGGAVHADAGTAKAAQGVGGTINLADGGAVHATPYQRRAGNYRKNGKCSTR